MTDHLVIKLFLRKKKYLIAEAEGGGGGGGQDRPAWLVSHLQVV
jgi:hypothetical protein